MLPCPLYQITGWQCPFCGVQRGIMALLHGDISTWWYYNPVVWCLVPYFAILVVGEVYRPLQKNRFVKACYNNMVIFSIAALLLIWGVIRNIY